MSLYFDAMASSIIAPPVVQAMQDIYLNHPGNSSSEHKFGHKLSAIVQKSEQIVKESLNAENYKVIWTSGATESINLAITGAAHAYKRQGQHIISFSTEHEATLATLKGLEARGFSCSILAVDVNGKIDLQALADTINHETILISICHVNNEIGTIQDIKAITKLAQERGCLVHIDAAQSIAKVTCDFSDVPADFISISAHKFSGPQGVGALLVRQTPARQLYPLINGGKQQKLRAGTLPAALIVGLSEAIKLDPKTSDIKHWHAIIIKTLSKIGAITINGCLSDRVPHNININIAGVHSELIKYFLPDVAISSGSACHAQSPEPSHVILALGNSKEYAAHSLRISLGRHLDAADIASFCQRLESAIESARAIAGIEGYVSAHDYIGPPEGEYITKKKIKIPEVYFIIWYQQPAKISFNAMGPPILIEIATEIANLVNSGVNHDLRPDIKQALRLSEADLFHLDFALKALSD